MNTFLETLKEIIGNALSASFELFKVMIPLIFLVKILQEAGCISYLAWPLEPLMRLVGLPAEMGIVWATTIVNNIYTGIIVLASLIGDTPISTAQATTLGVLMLVAHGIPVECAVARQAGARFFFQAIIRLLCAFGFAWLLQKFYTMTHTLQEPATFLFQLDPNTNTHSFLDWGIDQMLNLASIFCIILVLMSIMRLLQALKIINMMNSLLNPILNLIGIGPKASAITVIGLTMGLSYGGGIIISEAKKGNMKGRDIFYSLTLMGLSHSLIEDTLLIMLIGGHISGVLWGRLFLTLATMAGVVQVVRRLPVSFQNKYLWS